VGASKGFRVHQAEGESGEDCGGYVWVSAIDGSAALHALSLSLVGAALIMSSTAPQIMVISSEGLFQAYNIDLDNGGECSLMKEFACVSDCISFRLPC